MHGKGGLHCRRCCSTFTGVTAFDKHWAGGHKSPADAGLTEVRPGVWGLPQTERGRVRLAALRASA